jgi:hypothetical protein
MARPTDPASGRAFVLSETPAVLDAKRAEEARRAREVDAWCEALDDQVSASRLTPQDKSSVWAHIKATRPDLVAFFADPEVARLIKQCGAVPRFDRTLIEEALRGSA